MHTFQGLTGNFINDFFLSQSPQKRQKTEYRSQKSGGRRRLEGWKVRGLAINRKRKDSRIQGVKDSSGSLEIFFKTKVGKGSEKRRIPLTLHLLIICFQSSILNPQS